MSKDEVILNRKEIRIFGTIGQELDSVDISVFIGQ